MNAHTMFPSKYLKAADLDGHEPIVTISEVSVESMGASEDQKENKPVIYFEGKEKGVVCNVTNWNTLIGLFGDETNLWIGKKIKLVTAEVAFKGKMTLSIRISSVKVPQGEASKLKKVLTQNQTEEATDGDAIPF